MVRFGRRHGDEQRRSAGTEDPVVRQYRFLLRESSPDAVEVAHTEALANLSEAQRQAVLGAVQSGLVAGHRLSPDDTAQMAHLIVAGERRAPNAFLEACESSTLVALSRAVIDSDACFGLFGRYAAWDGVDPEPEDESAWADAGFDPDSGRWNPRRSQNRFWEGRTGSGVPDSGGGG